MATYNLSIPDMSCAHCENRIRAAVKEAGGTVDSLNLDTKVVTVTTDLAEDALIAVIDDAGYDAKILK